MLIKYVMDWGRNDGRSTGESRPDNQTAQEQQISYLPHQHSQNSTVNRKLMVQNW